MPNSERKTIPFLICLNAKRVLLVSLLLLVVTFAFSARLNRPRRTPPGKSSAFS